MSTEAAAVRTPEQTQELTRRAVGVTFDFVRAAAADPSVADDVPDGATLALIPDDDPTLASMEIEQGMAAIHRGENVYFRHVPSASETESVWTESRIFDRQYREIWERRTAGELTTNETIEELDALLARVSEDAVRMATRRRRVTPATLREQTGVPPSPTMVSLLALADEMGEALDSSDALPANVLEQVARMIDLFADYRRELNER